MSAWYVLSSMGIYQVCPGQKEFMIGSPLFTNVVIHTDEAHSFTIVAKNNSAKNIYLAPAGNEYSCIINYDEIMKGGTKTIEMTNTYDPLAVPPILNVYSGHSKEIVPVPVIEAASGSFKRTIDVELKSVDPKSKLYYTVDGSVPTPDSKLFSGTFTVDQTTTVKSIAVSDKIASMIATATYYKIPHPDWKIKIIGKYNPQYTAGGDEGIIDGLHGTENWRKGDWQGYQSQDFEAVVDLAKAQAVSSVSSTYLQDSRSWILMPVKVEYSFSTDGINFSNSVQVENTINPKDNNVQLKDFSNTLPAPVTARYVKVKALNYGKLPQWHQGFGGDAFIFIDEITVN